MEAKRYGYFEQWRGKPAECTDCGWTGELGQSEPGGEERIHRLCPECDAVLAVVYEPSVENARENWDSLSAEQKAEIERIERRLESRQAHMEHFEATMLRSADQLPDIAEPHFSLTWDVETPEAGEFATIICQGERIIWREVAHWQDHERFGLVAGILKERYGARLEDLVPTREAELYLYGDSLGALHYVDAVRRGLREHHRLAM